MSKARQIYWDSCCYIALIKGEPAHLTNLQNLIRDAESGAIQLVGSALVLAEVIRPRRMQLGLSQQEFEEKVLPVMDSGWIAYRPVTMQLARDARKLALDHALKPVDAIHLATAIQSECVELHTTDPGLLRLKGNSAFKCQISEPVWTGQNLIAPEGPARPALPPSSPPPAHGQTGL